LLDHEPEILHCSGQGGGALGLAFVDGLGRLQVISGESLARLFELCAYHLRCVVLNACLSEIQARAISQHVEFVVGMSQEIGDEASIKFSEGFYDALGAGRSPEKAFEFGKSAIDLRSFNDYMVPVLLRNLSVRRSSALAVNGGTTVKVVPKGLRFFGPEPPTSSWLYCRACAARTDFP